MVKGEALVGQLPQCGRPLGVHSQGGKALGHDPHQVLPLEIARPLVFLRGLPLGKPLVGLQQGLVRLLGDELVKVEVHDVIFGGGIPGLLLRGRPVQGADPLGPVPHVRVVRGDAPHQAADLQGGLGEHAEVLHLQLRRGGAVIHIAQGQIAPAAQIDHAHHRQLHQNGRHGPPDAQPSRVGLVPDDTLPPHSGEDHRQCHHQDGEPV